LLASSMWAEQIKKTGTASSNRFDEFRNENEEVIIKIIDF
jgi:hypothetical protein